MPEEIKIPRITVSVQYSLEGSHDGENWVVLQEKNGEDIKMYSTNHDDYRFIRKTNTRTMRWK